MQSFKFIASIFHSKPNRELFLDFIQLLFDNRKQLVMVPHLSSNIWQSYHYSKLSYHFYCSRLKYIFQQLFYIDRIHSGNLPFIHRLQHIQDLFQVLFCIIQSLLNIRYSILQQLHMLNRFIFFHYFFPRPSRTTNKILHSFTDISYNFQYPYSIDHFPNPFLYLFSIVKQLIHIFIANNNLMLVFKHNQVEQDLYLLLLMTIFTLIYNPRVKSSSNQHYKITMRHLVAIIKPFYTKLGLRYIIIYRSSNQLYFSFAKHFQDLFKVLSYNFIYS